MPEHVILGTDVETGQVITIGDMERRSGLYILGRPRTGKTTLIKNILLQDIENEHGVFFLDPHGDAIEDLQKRIPARRQGDVIILDPTDSESGFGMNLLACADITKLGEREKTFDQAITIFTKLFANPQSGSLDVLLDKYLRNSFYPLIANQGYTIAEIPIFLTDKDFREHLLQHPTIDPEVVRFWHTEFAQLSPADQRSEIQSTLTRLGSFTRPYIKHIVGQSQTTLDFTDIMDTGKILFVKLSAALSDDHRRIIGTILISNLVRAVFQREQLPEQERRHFCIFVDEFQNFAGSEDFAVLFTQAPKYAVATTIAHQERFGQFADNKAILGATDAAGNKIFFQLANRDAQEQAAEVAKPSPTETKQERHLGISQQPFADLLRGHTHPDIHRFMQMYLRPLQYRLEDSQDDLEGERLLRLALLDEAALSRLDERYEALHASMARGRALPVSHQALQHTEQLLEQVQEQTERLRRLTEYARGLKLSIRSLNMFLTAIMEGKIAPEPEQELFSQFLLAFVPLAASLPPAVAPAFALYIQLVYGHPALTRAIPLTLAARFQAIPHEELYRSVEAQYIRQVQTAAEESRQEKLAELNDERQDEYERVVRKIMTWKRQVARYIWYLQTPHFLSVEKDYKFFQAMRLQPIRAFLTPYLFAKFAPPWYYDDPHGHPPSIQMPPNFTREMQEYTMFLHQYGEGALVVMALLKAAFCGRGEDSNNATERPSYVNELPSHLRDILAVPDISTIYPHPHMLELPAIAGMEPFHVWQVVRQLNELLVTLNVSLHDENILQSDTLLWIDLSERHDASLLMAQVETNFPDAAQLRAWWPKLTEEDVQHIGRRRDLLAWQVKQHHKYGMPVVREEVRRQLARYQEEQRKRNGGEAHALPALTTARAPEPPLPYTLERMWYRCDEMTRTYLIARACDWVTYGDLVADRTFPQPTLPGIPPQEVSAAVAVLIDLLLQALAKESASAERAYAQKVDKLVRECLWIRDGLLHLHVYQAEGRVHLRGTGEWYLPARVLTPEERKTLTDACYTELARASRLLETLNDFVTFCQLLRQPENHVRSATQVYVEREVNTYTTAEMTNQMVQELINLLPHSAYVKSAWKGKIQTLAVDSVPGAILAAGMRDLVDVRMSARQHAISAGILRTRSDIEAEIRERQENWRRRRGHEPPPPTSTEGNSPPSLPSGSSERTSEPPLTRKRGSKPPVPQESPRKRPKNTTVKTPKRPQVPRKRGK